MAETVTQWKSLYMAHVKSGVQSKLAHFLKATS